MEPLTMTSKDLRRQLNLLGAAVLLVILMAFGIEKGYAWFIVNYSGLLEGYDLSAVNTGLEMVSWILIYFLPFFLCRLALKIKAKELFEKPACNGLTLIKTACGAASVYLVFTFLSSGIQNVLFANQIPEMSVHPILLGNFWTLKIVYLLFFVLIIPLLEEYVFRGVILRCTSHAGGWFGMISSALLYMLFCFGKSSLLVSFTLGLYLALVSMVYRSIWPSFFAHVAVNLVILAGFFLPGQFSWVFGILAVVVYAVSGFALIQNRTKKIVLNQNFPARAAWKCFFTSAVLIFAMFLLIFRAVYYIIV